jgi:hypothetical protein
VSVSNPRDIVRVFDARVAAVPATIARSKQIVAEAKTELDQHRRWLERHRQRAAADLKRHARRQWRQNAIAACTRAGTTLVLLLTHRCLALLRGAIRDGILLCRLLAAGGRSIDAAAYAVGLWLAGVAMLACATIGAAGRACGVWLTGVVLLAGASIGTQARILAPWLAAMVLRGCSLFGSNAHHLWLRLIDMLAQGIAAAGAEIRGLGLSLVASTKRHFAQRRARASIAAREDARDRIDLLPAPARRPAGAGFDALQAEHDGLQHRIQAISALYGRRAVNDGVTGGVSSQDWAQLRALSENARRLFASQQHGLAGNARSSGAAVPDRLNQARPPAVMNEARAPAQSSCMASSAPARVVYGPRLSAPLSVRESTGPRSRIAPAVAQTPLKVKLGIGGAWSGARERLWRCRGAVRGGALMEHRAILPAFGVLAAVLVLAAIGSQAPAADPSRNSVKENAAPAAQIMADAADETRVSTVAKSPRSAPPVVSAGASDDPGLGTTSETLEALPRVAMTVPSLMEMATYMPVVAVEEPAALPVKVAAVPRAVTAKAKQKPAAREPPVQSSWLRPSWLRLPWSPGHDEAETKLGFDSNR